MSIKVPDYGLPSPWQPITESVELAVLGKLIEELGECSAAAGRCIIQGFDEDHPVTNKNNGEWLLEEMADVLAGFAVTLAHFNVNQEDLSARVEAKIKHLQTWHKGIR